MALISLVFITLAAILSCKETVARCECHNRESLESTAVGTHSSERSLLISLDSFCMYRASHILLFSNSLEQTASERCHAWLTNCKSTCTARSMYYFFHRLGVQERVHRSVWSWEMKSKVLIWSWKGVSLNRISVQKAEGHATSNNDITRLSKGTYALTEPSMQVQYNAIANRETHGMETNKFVHKVRRAARPNVCFSFYKGSSCIMLLQKCKSNPLEATKPWFTSNVHAAMNLSSILSKITTFVLCGCNPHLDW